MEYTDFLTNIESTLRKNGFPDRRVALPLERMYEVAYEKGLNFNKALEILRERNIDHEKTTTKVIFFSPSEVSQTADPSDLHNMMTQAQEMMKNMSPDELAKIQQLYENMNPAQKEDLMKRAKDMGLMP